MNLLVDDNIVEDITRAYEKFALKNKKILVIIPDKTRSAPIQQFFSLFQKYYAPGVKKLDYLIALGTHPLLTENQKLERLGITKAEQAIAYPDLEIHNHRWDLEETFSNVGTINKSNMAELSEGLIEERTPISVNKMIFNYDIVLVLGPVFPHEIAGFSGYTKYLFPGICGWNFIDSTHWLGALKTNIETIGKIDTPVRRMINKAAEFISVPIVYFNMVVNDEGLKGLFVGDTDSAWRKAAGLSGEVNIHYEPKQYEKVISIASPKYADYWTGAKAFYKLEPIVADGGEIIVYAPHIHDISITHNKVLEKIGFHVVDYFKAYLDTKFKKIPRTTLAFSALVKGKGAYQDGMEATRISHKLALNIPKAVLDSLNLAWEDKSRIDIEKWKNKESNGIKVVFNAGEKLFRTKESPAE